MKGNNPMRYAIVVTVLVFAGLSPAVADERHDLCGGVGTTSLGCDDKAIDDWRLDIKPGEKVCSIMVNALGRAIEVCRRGWPQ
jgi:hypothetical protein